MKEMTFDEMVEAISNGGDTFWKTLRIQTPLDISKKCGSTNKVFTYVWAWGVLEPNGWRNLFGMKPRPLALKLIIHTNIASLIVHGRWLYLEMGEKKLTFPDLDLKAQLVACVMHARDKYNLNLEPKQPEYAR